MMIKEGTCGNTLYLMVSIFPDGMATSVDFKGSPFVDAKMVPKQQI